MSKSRERAYREKGDLMGGSFGRVHVFTFACPTISEKNKGENAESTESKDLYKK